MVCVGVSMLGFLRNNGGAPGPRCGPGAGGKTVRPPALISCGPNASVDSQNHNRLFDHVTKRSCGLGRCSVSGCTPCSICIGPISSRRGLSGRHTIGRDG